MKNWDFSATVSLFTTLTIGDGLASQIPAFIIAVAAGLIVARTGNRETIGDEVPMQLASQPRAMYLVAFFLAVLALTPLPTIPLLVAAIVVIGIRSFFIQPFIIPTNSMYPTYNGMQPHLYEGEDELPQERHHPQHHLLHVARWRVRPHGGELLIECLLSDFAALHVHYQSVIPP